MKKLLIILISGFVFLVFSCKKVDQMFDPTNELILKSANVPVNYTAHLSGDQEVPPKETLATGQAIFQLNKEGTELSYKLIVANLEDLHMSHIHIAPPGTNGGVVVWLYPSAPPAVMLPGTTNGILATGTITSASLVGALKGKTLNDLIVKMNEGNAYVNVHTMMNPGGEIRGQITGARGSK
jgi:hypothetical protein